MSFRALSKMSAIERDRALSQGALGNLLNAWIEERFDLSKPQLPDLSQETIPRRPRLACDDNGDSAKFRSAT